MHLSYKMISEESSLSAVLRMCISSPASRDLSVPAHHSAASEKAPLSVRSGQHNQRLSI